MFLVLVALMEVMGCSQLVVRILACLAISWVSQCAAQFPRTSTTLARQLDSLLQDYAYRAFLNPRTGIVYNGVPPSNSTGVEIAIIRLRSGSLRSRGVRSFKEFDIPAGVIVQPYVKRLAFVYQNLGNWSSFYYPLPGYSYLAPVFGILAYNAANLSATNLPELDITASSSPITINFTNARSAPRGFAARCVWFNLNGSFKFMDFTTANVCSTFRQGHFSIVVNSTAIPPAPLAVVPTIGPGEGHKSNAWKIVVSVVGGFVGILLLSWLVAWLVSFRKKDLMEKQKKGR